MAYGTADDYNKPKYPFVGAIIGIKTTIDPVTQAAVGFCSMNLIALEAKGQYAVLLTVGHCAEVFAKERGADSFGISFEPAIGGVPFDPANRLVISNYLQIGSMIVHPDFRLISPLDKSANDLICYNFFN